jgi:hypothetical protein
MPLSITQTTNLSLTSSTFSIFPSAFSLGVYVRRPYPFSALSCWTVDSVFGRVFGEALVPGHLEAVVEEFVDVLKGDVVDSTALGRHVLRVVDGETEDAFEACMAHSMSALEFCRFRMRYVVGHARQTFDPVTSVCVIERLGSYAYNRGGALASFDGLAGWVNMPIKLDLLVFPVATEDSYPPTFVLV